VSGLPAVTLYQEVDRASKVQSWPMYLNDQIGDCTIAGAAHMFSAMAAYARDVQVTFADAEIQRVYSAVGGYVPGNPATDNGCVMEEVLAWLKANPMTDEAGGEHKVLGYARIGNPADEVLIGQVLDVFGSVYVGFDVQQSVMTEFENHQPWTWTAGEPYVGGHCVVLQRRDPCGSVVGVLNYVTWGALQRATFPWQAHTVSEAWAVVTEDWLNTAGQTVEGLDVSQLLSDMAYV
jgi:hypothetical protein